MSKNIIIICITAIIIALIKELPESIREIKMPDNIMSVTGFLTEQQRKL